MFFGGANNQLDEERHGEALQEKEIIYLPDYVVNGGGLIRVAAEWYGVDHEIYEGGIDRIYDNLKQVFEIARSKDVNTREAAARLAEMRIEGARALDGDRDELVAAVAGQTLLIEVPGGIAPVEEAAGRAVDLEVGEACAGRGSCGWTASARCPSSRRRRAAC